MNEHPNAARFREVMDAFNAGDRDALADALADDVVWHMIGGGTLHGKEAVAESMSGLADVDLDAELHDVVANDEHLVGLVEAHVKAGDKEITYRTAEIAHVEDGKITERWAFSDDTQRIIDFFDSLGGE